MLYLTAVQFTLRQRDRSAAYGWDAHIGFWVEVRDRGRIVRCYDCLSEGYNAARPLHGALLFLVASGFFTREEIGDALARGRAEVPEEVPARVGRVAEVIANFRRAAD